MTDRTGLPDPAVQSRLPLVLLSVGIVLAALAPLLTLVTAADGSSTRPPLSSNWVVLLPLVVVAVLSFAGRAAGPRGLGAVVGVGVLVCGRAVADLGVLVAPDTVLRPELFGVTSVSAFPLSATAAAALPLLGDLLVLAALAAAASRLLDAVDQPDVDASQRRRVVRLDLATVVGLVGAALVVSASLGVLYDPPLPVVRPLGLGDIGLLGTAGAAVGAVVLGVLVVVCSGLPAGSARGALAGAAATAAVAPLTVLLGGAAAQPSSLVWVGLAGAVLLAGSAVLRREAGSADDEPGSPAGSAEPTVASEPPRPPSSRRWPSMLVGVVALAAAGAGYLAYVRPQIRSALGSDPTSIDAAGAGYLPVVVVLGVAGLVTLVPRTARAGRLALSVLWASAFAALLAALEFTSSSIWVSSAVIADGAVQRDDGSTWGLACAGLAVVAAIGAAVVSVRDADDTTGDGFGPLDGRRTAIGGGLTLIAVLAFAIPVFDANGRSGPTLFELGTRVDGYGNWVSLIVVAIAVWVAVRPGDPRRTVALLVAGAALVGARLVVTPAVRHQQGFELQVGFWVSAVLTVLLLAAIPVLVRQPQISEPAPLPRLRPVPVKTPPPAARVPQRVGASPRAARPKGKQGRR